LPEQGVVPNGVTAALEALKPPEVLEAQRRQGITGKDRQRRKNAAAVRQGEWFFLPLPKRHLENKQVLRDEPLSRGKPRAKTWNWRRLVRNPEAVVKGKVRHPDHKTLVLQVWHKVVMNTKGQSQAMRHVVFLD
jgi:hypothetical protein